MHVDIYLNKSTVQLSMSKSVYFPPLIHKFFVFFLMHNV